MPSLVYMDGKHMKNIELSKYPPEAWTYYSNPEGGDIESMSTIYRDVGWVNRAVKLRAGAVQTMPYSLLRGDKVICDQDTYYNVTGMMDDPRDIFWRVESSLIFFGSAYLLKEKAGLRYVRADTMTPKIDPVKGLIGFERRNRFISLDDVIYFMPSDPMVEAGAPGDSPLKSIRLPGMALVNLDRFISEFFERGAIKATLLAVSGNPPEAERRRIRQLWQKMMSGIKSAWQTFVVNADEFRATVIGDGIENLRNTRLNDSLIQDICTGLGVPHSLLMSNAANYATAKTDVLSFYSMTIKPECEFIAGVLNKQLFSRYGLRLRFDYEQHEVFQSDEAERAQSLAQLTGAGMPLPLAMDILGYDLTEEQRLLLEEHIERATVVEQEQLVQELPPPVKEELARWRRKAIKALSQGKSPAVDFVSPVLTDDIVIPIRDALAQARDENDVKMAFVMAGLRPAMLRQDTLLSELKRLNDLLESKQVV